MNFGSVALALSVLSFPAISLWFATRNLNDIYKYIAINFITYFSTVLLSSLVVTSLLSSLLILVGAGYFYALFKIIFKNNLATFGRFILGLLLIYALMFSLFDITTATIIVI